MSARTAARAAAPKPAARKPAPKAQAPSIAKATKNKCKDALARVLLHRLTFSAGNNGHPYLENRTGGSLPLYVYILKLA